ncbi:MAG TPA: hypothetical protein VMV50_02155, partial [Candidatus Paceibacterota bacterium]|nr:hypothetical protein [Candidatus Paceibacterota bacterium]
EMEKIERYKGKTMFLSPPIRDEGADVGIFVVDADGYHTDTEGYIVMTKNTEEAIFQVKEYVDYERMRSEKIVVPKPLDPKFFHIKKLKTYESKIIILIFIRDSRTFTVLDLRVALKELNGRKIYVILSFLADVPIGNGKVIKLVPNSFNFLIIDVWAEPQDIRHVWFEEPKGFKHV